ncbi:MAG TPA: DsrH/TusB family sulfur metabolism protein [Candidatus Hypogeohydataceae bacterium YC41]
MKILHIVREKGHELALSTALSQSINEGIQKVTVLLIHDAVLTNKDSAALLGGMEVFALKDDVEARGVKASYPLLDYEGMLRLIFESDKVITW